MKRKDWKTALLAAGDTLFVLILCFAVLLTTMLISRAFGTADGACAVRPAVLAGVLLSVGGFLWFLLKNSLSALRELVRCYFQEKKREEADPDDGKSL